MVEGLEHRLSQICITQYRRLTQITEAMTASGLKENRVSAFLYVSWRGHSYYHLSPKFHASPSIGQLASPFATEQRGRTSRQLHGVIGGRRYPQIRNGV